MFANFYEKEKYIDPKGYVRKGKYINPKRHKRSYSVKDFLKDAVLVGSAIGLGTGIARKLSKRSLKSSRGAVENLITKAEKPRKVAAISPEIPAKQPESILERTKVEIETQPPEVVSIETEKSKPSVLYEPSNTVENTSPLFTTEIVLLKDTRNLPQPANTRNWSIEDQKKLKAETLITNASFSQDTGSILFDNFGFSNIIRRATFGEGQVKPTIIANTLVTRSHKPDPEKYIDHLNTGFIETSNRIFQSLPDSSDINVEELQESIYQLFMDTSKRNDLRMVNRQLMLPEPLKEFLVRDAFRQYFLYRLYDNVTSLKRSTKYLTESPEYGKLYSTNIGNIVVSGKQTPVTLAETITSVRALDGETLPKWLVFDTDPNALLDQYPLAKKKKIQLIQESTDLQEVNKEYLIQLYEYYNRFPIERRSIRDTDILLKRAVKDYDLRKLRVLYENVDLYNYKDYILPFLDGASFYIEELLTKPLKQDWLQRTYNFILGNNMKNVVLDDFVFPGLVGKGSSLDAKYAERLIKSIEEFDKSIVIKNPSTKDFYSQTNNITSFQSHSFLGLY